MPRTINVSTDVFAAIWSNRQESENSEDAILRRLLGCGAAQSDENAHTLTEGGVKDTRNGVHFPEGFVIFRTYKGKDYSAVAQGGAWVLSTTGDTYPTLNQLNASIAMGAENVWNGNWKYKDSDGINRSIGDLRR